MGAKEIIDCAMFSYNAERIKLEQHFEDLKDAAKKKAAELAIKATFKKFVETSTGVALGMTGSFAASLAGQAVGAAVGALVVAGSKAVTNARTVFAVDYICPFFKESQTFPEAKTFPVGNFSCQVVAVGRANGIDAEVKINFFGVQSKKVVHENTLSLKQNTTASTRPENLMMDYSFDSIGIDIVEISSTGSRIPVLLSEEVTMVPICDKTHQSEKLIYVAYVCLKGTSFGRKDLGIGRWRWMFKKPATWTKIEAYKERLLEEHNQQ